jgi:putative Mn2+ efflux pump MntP
MCVVAWKTVHWKEERLGEDFKFVNAYWFSFITTTTVGLGDFYLEHQVLLRRDLVAFSLLILMGFVFLANFLVKLTDLLTECFPRIKSSNLDERLKATNMMWHLKRKTGDHAQK